MSQLIYLASPYSHPEEAVREARFVDACMAAGALMAAGLHVFSPIAHTHPIAVRCDLPTGWDFWEAQDTAYLNACAGVIVLMLPGWIDSKGIMGEVAIANARGIPVRHYSLDDVLAAPELIRRAVDAAIAKEAAHAF
jgi:hypothetical protein